MVRYILMYCWCDYGRRIVEKNEKKEKGEKMSIWKQKIRKINGKRRRVKVRTVGSGRNRKEYVRILGYANTTDRSRRHGGKVRR